MADVRGIYTIDRAGTATLVKNLEDGSGFFAVRDSVTITPAPRKQVMAAGQNRYEGSVQVGETHDNGTYAWQCLVAGSSIDDALTKAEALIGVGEAFGPGRYLGWSPAGATNISYCEIRGAFTFKPGYQPQQFVQTKTWVIDVSVPVAPLVRKAQVQRLTLPSTTMPAVLQIGTLVNPSFETDATGWVFAGDGTSMILASTTDWASVGSRSLYMNTTAGTANYYGAATFDNSVQKYLSVSPGDVVTVTADQRSIAGPAGAYARVDIQWFDAGGGCGECGAGRGGECRGVWGSGGVGRWGAGGAGRDCERGSCRYSGVAGGDE